MSQNISEESHCVWCHHGFMRLRTTGQVGEHPCELDHERKVLHEPSLARNGLANAEDPGVDDELQQLVLRRCIGQDPEDLLADLQGRGGQHWEKMVRTGSQHALGLFLVELLDPGRIREGVGDQRHETWLQPLGTALRDPVRSQRRPDAQRAEKGEAGQTLHDHRHQGRGLPGGHALLDHLKHSRGLAVEDAQAPEVVAQWL
mmetsp:Transcript_107432/g.256731  ORF Transcript_107432/g.256731 Transcript_107432/m.256731 type:complete len:202 (-) Transcript_107432:268-873(-)